ncbi:MAG: hypothetical protein JJE50_12785, partial [Actinomycetales bacterium]|nr:hypothetical protein [Actinomycetales bacterium]
ANTGWACQKSWSAARLGNVVARRCAAGPSRAAAISSSSRHLCLDPGGAERRQGRPRGCPGERDPGQGGELLVDEEQHRVGEGKLLGHLTGGEAPRVPLCGLSRPANLAG